MKLISALAAVAFLASPALMSAMEYPWLTFRMADSTELSVAADDLVMNYADGKLILSSESVDQTLDVASIRTMRFTSESVGIADISVAASSDAEYYTTSGVVVGRFDSIDDARRSLPSGAYVGRGENGSFKVVF